MSYSWGNNYSKEGQIRLYEGYKQQNYYNYGMSTFAEVEQAYNSILPIRGARANQDLRPLNKRSRTWERVVKFDDNTYGLYDGFGVSREFGDDNFKTGMPILWERREIGRAHV